MNIGPKVLSVVTALGVVATAIAAFGLYELAKANAEIDTLVKEYVSEVVTLKAVSDDYAVYIVDASHKARNGNQSFVEALDQIKSADTRIKASLDDFLSKEHPSEEMAIIQNVLAQRQVADSATKTLIEILESDDRPALDIFVKENLYQSIDPLTETLGKLINLIVSESQSLHEVAESEYVMGRNIAIGTVAISMLLTLASWIIVRRQVITPIRKLSSGMNSMNAGELDVKIEGVASRDELGVMARSLETLRQNAKEAFRLGQIVNEMPINIMLADPESGTITYANKKSIETLTGMQSLMPVRVENLIGTSIDVFHKNPGHQRAIIRDPGRLPWNAKIKLGPETLDLRISAIRDQKGGYMGPLLSWSVITAQVHLANDFESNVKSVVEIVASSATEMQSSSQSLSNTAEQSGQKAMSVAAAA